jgi:hypothetical protein
MHCKKLLFPIESAKNQSFKKSLCIDMYICMTCVTLNYKC